ncbi:hypothetical protein MMC17_006603 [Xylographa soralifera]|nr:hypothetical protein [Xylographa soralifera]
MLFTLRRFALNGRPMVSQERFVSSPMPKRFAISNVSKHSAPAQKEVDRACGVPENSTEAGPRDPSDIFRAILWVMAPAFVLGGAAFWIFMPSSPSKSGQAIQRRNREGRLASERKEGYEGEEETPEMRELEAGLIKEAAKKKKEMGKV